MTEIPSALLEVTGITHAYGHSRVLRDVSLEISKGEFLSIIGPSGCGKSTLLKIMAGIVPPSGGEVRFEGQPIADLAPAEHSVLMMWQSLALFPHLNVGANVGFGLAVQNIDRQTQERRIADALRLVELQGFEGRGIGTLSGGEQQRVALARALVLNPKVLLLDEPVGGLDRQLRERLIGTIRQLHRQLGTTMVMVTHEQSEAISLSTRVAVMRNGQIEQIDTPANVLECPTTRFVGEFLGDRNVFSGRVIEVAERRVRVVTEIGAIGALLPAWLSYCPSLNDEVAYVIDSGKIALERDGENGLAARVEAIVKAGIAETIEFTTSANTIIKLQRAANAGLPRLVPGDRVELAWRTADAYILPSDRY